MSLKFKKLFLSARVEQMHKCAVDGKSTLPNVRQKLKIKQERKARTTSVCLSLSLFVLILT